MRLVLISFCLMLNAISVSAQSGGDGIFALSRNGDTFKIEWFDVPQGAEVTLPSEVISPILPISVGQSGDIVQEAQRSARVVVKNTLKGIVVDAYRPDGSVRNNPPVTLASLRSYDIRVNVTAWNGLRKAFVIQGYASVADAEGPVIDLFRGMIPLQTNDISTTLVTTVRQNEPLVSVSGSATLLYENGLLLTEVMDHNGVARLFIVDFGAGATVVTKGFLPDETTITELTAIERSEKGDRVLRGSMQAAGGEVSSFIGQAKLEKLVFGDISAGEVAANVIGEMPRFGDAEIFGIIGIDVLQRGGTVFFSYGSPGRLIFGDDETPSDRSVPVPFTVAGKHIFLRGALEGRPVLYLFDTGARFSIVSAVAAEIGEVPLSHADVRSVRGLDGQPMDARTTKPLSVTLNGTSLGSAAFSVIDLPVLKGMGLEEAGAILGNDFLSGFSGISVDFAGEQLRLRR